MSFDDLYNNFKIVEQEVKGTASSSSSSSSQNMAFVSSPSSTNEVNTTYGVSPANTQVSPSSTQVNTASTQVNTTNLSDDTVYAFLASQPNGSQLVYEDLEQIHKDDIEETDLKWQLALLSMRTIRGHRNQDSRNRNQDNSRRTINVEIKGGDSSSKAMGVLMEAGFDWSYMRQLMKVPYNYKLFWLFQTHKTQNLVCLNLNLSYSSIEEFQHPQFEGYGPKSSKNVSEDIFNEVRESPDAPLVEELGHKVLGNQRNWNDQQKAVNTARPNSTVVNVVRANQVNAVKASGHPQKEDQGYVDSGCSRHMTGNMSYLSDFKKFDGGYVTFGGGAKGGKITGKGTLKTADESQVLLKVPKKNNMYNVDMKNIVPKESVTCLVAKATLEESMLWHRRLGHVNFKTINKLVKENLVRGLPLKHFENDQTCVACLKGKQHKASSTKDETSGILKSFITEIENLVDKKVKIIRCDNGTEFKNRVMSEFCEQKGIKREFSVARTPQQNSVAERRNRTLIESARTMVLVVKPHNKTPYELFRGRTPALSFIRPFGCHVTILNTLDYLGKFDGNSDEGFFVRYSLNSKAFKVYNIRTRKVEENLHIRFLKDKPIIAGDGPKWLFDIDVLTKLVNYIPVVAGTNSNDLVGTKESIGVGHSSKETRSSQDYILMPLWKDGSLFDSSLKNASNDEPQPSSDAGKKDDEGVNKESGIDDQERPKNSTQDVNTSRPSINTANTNLHTGSLNINTVSLTVTTAPLEATHADFFGDETKIDMSNITTTYLVPSTPNTSIYKDHSLDHVIGDVQSGVQTRRMTKSTNEQGFISAVYEGKYNRTFILVCFCCGFYRRIEPKRAIGTKWVYKNKKDKSGIVVRNKARLVAHGYTQEKGIDYDEVFTQVARIEAIRLLLAYASIMELWFEDPKFLDRVYEVEKALYGLHQVPRAWYETLSTYFKGSMDFPRRDVDIHLYRSMIGSLMYITHPSSPDIMFAVCACARFQVTPKVSHLHAMKRIFKYLKGQPKLGLWYPKDSPFDLEAYTDNDYAGVSLDRKSTTGATANCYGQVLWIQNQMLDYGYNFMNTKIFIDNESTIYIVKNLVFHSKIKHIEIRHHFIRDSNEKKLIQMIQIHTDQNVADLLTKAFDVSRF
ncbi:putative ribonuclease H-like domain-containing protein [Tanacetum coccineum]